MAGILAGALRGLSTAAVYQPVQNISVDEQSVWLCWCVSDISPTYSLGRLKPMGLRDFKADKI